MSWREDTQSVGMVARAAHPDHARHGFVSHAPVLESYEFDVRCECGALLRICANAVRRGMEDRELAAWSQSITNSISNGPSTANDLTIENLLNAQRYAQRLMDGRWRCPPMMEEEFRLPMKTRRSLDSFRGLPIPFGTFGTRIGEPA